MTEKRWLVISFLVFQIPIPPYWSGRFSCTLWLTNDLWFLRPCGIPAYLGCTPISNGKHKWCFFFCVQVQVFFVYFCYWVALREVGHTQSFFCLKRVATKLKLKPIVDAFDFMSCHILYPYGNIMTPCLKLVKRGKSFKVLDLFVTHIYTHIFTLGIFIYIHCVYVFKYIYS